MADDTSASTLSTDESTAASLQSASPTEPPRTPFRQEISAAPDDVALRDDLTGAQSSSTRAAQLSGERFSRLLYGPDVATHLSPYGVAPVPNALDNRET